MRALLLATSLGIGLLAGVASAADFTDSAQRMKFDAPAGWTTSQERSDGFSYVVTGTANNECHLLARPNTATASAPAESIRRAAANDAQFGQDQWLRIANSMSPVFPNNSAQFVSRTTDSSGFWPIQRAELRNAERTVHGAMQIRPGMDWSVMCQTYDGPDTSEGYGAIIHSLGTPNDATLQAAAEAEAATDAANAAANAADQANEGNNRRRRN